MEVPRPDVEVVRGIYNAVRDYLRGDREGAGRRLEELIAPSASMVPSSALASGSVGPSRGAQGMVALLSEAQERWSMFEPVADEFIFASPDTVVVLGRVSASRPGGQGYAVTVGQLWQLDGHMVVAMHSFQSQDRALEAAGVTRGESAPRRSEDP